VAAARVSGRKNSTTPTSHARQRGAVAAAGATMVTRAPLCRCPSKGGWKAAASSASNALQNTPRTFRVPPLQRQAGSSATIALQQGAAHEGASDDAASRVVAGGSAEGTVRARRAGQRVGAQSEVVPDFLPALPW
jgi:hypothetical protein